MIRNFSRTLSLKNRTMDQSFERNITYLFERNTCYVEKNMSAIFFYEFVDFTSKSFDSSIIIEC